MRTVQAILCYAACHPVLLLRGSASRWIVLEPGACQPIRRAATGGAILVGRWMRRRKLTHLHSSFALTLALLVARLYRVTLSFGVYGYGELYDPAGARLKEMIHSSVFVRSVRPTRCGTVDVGVDSGPVE